MKSGMSVLLFSVFILLHLILLGVMQIVLWFVRSGDVYVSTSLA